MSLITIDGPTYMNLHVHVLYEWLASWLSMFGRRKAYREAAHDTQLGSCLIPRWRALSRTRSRLLPECPDWGRVL